MKKLFVVGALTLSCSLSALSDVKIAVVDTGRAFDLYYKTEETAGKIAMKESIFKKEIKDLQSEYQQEDREADTLAAAAKDKSLSVDIRQARDAALALKVENLQSMQNELRNMAHDRTSEMQEVLLRSHEEISEQITKVVTDYAVRGGYDLVLDVSYDPAGKEVALLPFRTAKVFDITEEIIRKLNATAPAPSGTAK